MDKSAENVAARKFSRFFSKFFRDFFVIFDGIVNSKHCESFYFIFYVIYLQESQTETSNWGPAELSESQEKSVTI